MTKRKYQIFSVAGNNDELIRKLLYFVQNNNLEEIILRLCVEKRSRSSWQKYLFLQIDDDFIDDALERLETIGFRPLDSNNPVSIDEIKTMVSSEIKLEDFVRKISYNPLADTTLEDPFSYEGEVAEGTIDASSYRENLNHLIYWCSAKGEGSWQLFRKTYIAFGIKNTVFSARQLSRRLRLLGIIDLYDSGSKWACFPPAIARVNANSNHYFLLGQRVPGIIQKLREKIDLEILSQSDQGGPDYISFSISPDTLARELAQHSSLDYVGDISNTLCGNLSTMQGYQEGLEAVHVEPYAYQAHRWIDKEFQEVSFGDTGLYQLSKPDFPNAPIVTAFFDAELDKWFRGDWYGLRYLSIVKSGTLTELRWENEILAVPYLQRIPDVYERVLVLASGKLPDYRNGWLYFEGISIQLAQKIIALLENGLVLRKG